MPASIAALKKTLYDQKDNTRLSVFVNMDSMKILRPIALRRRSLALNLWKD